MNGESSLAGVDQKFSALIHLWEESAVLTLDALRKVLRQNAWTVSQAARLLGVSRMTLYRRMERLGVSQPL